MRWFGVMVIALPAVVLLSCKRETAPPATRARANTAATSTAVANLADADEKLKIVKVRPVFVNRVELSLGGAPVADEPVVALPDKQSLTVTARMNKFPDGLMLRYEVNREGSEEPLLQERKAPDEKTSTTVFQVATQTLKKGEYELKLWAGGDQVFSRKFARK